MPAYFATGTLFLRSKMLLLLLHITLFLFCSCVLSIGEPELTDTPTSAEAPRLVIPVVTCWSTSYNPEPGVLRGRNVILGYKSNLTTATFLPSNLTQTIRSSSLGFGPSDRLAATGFTLFANGTQRFSTSDVTAAFFVYGARFLEWNVNGTTTGYVNISLLDDSLECRKVFGGSSCLVTSAFAIGSSSGFDTFCEDGSYCNGKETCDRVNVTNTSQVIWLCTRANDTTRNRPPCGIEQVQCDETTLACTAKEVTITPALTCWHATYANGVRFRTAVLGYSTTMMIDPAALPTDDRDALNRAVTTLFANQGAVLEFSNPFLFGFNSSNNPFFKSRNVSIAVTVGRATLIEWRINETTTGSINVSALSDDLMCSRVFNNNCSITLSAPFDYVPNFCEDGSFCNGREICNNVTLQCGPAGSGFVVSFLNNGIAGPRYLPTCTAGQLCNETALTCLNTTAPTAAPTASPTEAPTSSPTEAPTAAPTASPTEAPTAAPTASPTEAPTAAPTASPTEAPTASPTTGSVTTNCSYCTFTQGGYGGKCNSPSSASCGALITAWKTTQPGCLRDKCMSERSLVFVMGNITAGGKTVTFTTANAIKAFMPATGSALSVFTKTAINPTSTSAGKFATQLLTAMMNIRFYDSATLPSFSADCPLVAASIRNRSISEIIYIANQVIANQPGINWSPFNVIDLTAALDLFNKAFDQCTSNFPSCFTCQQPILALLEEVDEVSIGTTSSTTSAESIFFFVFIALVLSVIVFVLFYHNMCGAIVKKGKSLLRRNRMK